MSYATKKVFTGESLTPTKMNDDLSEVQRRLYAHHQEVRTLLVTGERKMTSSAGQAWPHHSQPLEIRLFPKLHDNTALMCLWYVGAFTKTAPTTCYFGVRVSGEIGQTYGLDLPCRMNANNTYVFFAGGVLITGLSAGKRTMRLYIKCEGGEPVYTNSNGFGTLHVIECNTS